MAIHKTLFLLHPYGGATVIEPTISLEEMPKRIIGNNVCDSAAQ